MQILDLKLTYRCNNNCYFCCQDRNLRNLDTDLSFYQVKKIVDTALYNKYLNVKKIVLTGGEPTLNKDIINIIKYVKAKNLIAQLQTNARTLCDKNFLMEIINSGIDSFGISLHGHTTAIHEKFTGTTNSFSETIDALNLIKQKNIPVCINCVVTKYNISFLNDIAKFVYDNCYCTQLQFAFIHIIGNAKNKINDVVSLSEASSKIKNAIDKNPKLKIYSEAIPFCFMYGHEKNVAELNDKLETISYDFNASINFNTETISSMKAKSTKCKNCLFDCVCYGTWKEYSEVFGFDEFIPITSFRKNYDAY